MKRISPRFYKKNLYALSIAVTFFLLFTNACSVTKQSEYFKTLQLKDTTLKGFVSNDFESKIIIGDKLSINVSSLSQMEDAFFNGASQADKSTSINGSNSTGYTVLNDGSIVLHRLGTIQVAGFTRKEIAKQIEKGLLPYMKEPIVQVSYTNHKITILGEVAKPQVLNMPEEQISLIDALVLSGDISLNGKRNNITIIRENGNEKQVKHINLEDHSIFSSTWYYVKPNDIIYVSADTDKFVKQEKRQKLQGTLSLIASAVSLLIIVLSQVFK